MNLKISDIFKYLAIASGLIMFGLSLMIIVQIWSFNFKSEYIPKIYFSYGLMIVNVLLFSILHSMTHKRENI
jgi:hypothetical protein